MRLLHKVHGCLEIRVSNTRGVWKTPTYLLCDKINIFFSTSGCYHLPQNTLRHHFPRVVWVCLGWLACKVRRVVPETQVPQQWPKLAIQCVPVVNVPYVWISSENLAADPPHRAPSSSADTVGGDSALDGCLGPCTPLTLCTRKCKIPYSLVFKRMRLFEKQQEICA